MCFGFWRLAEPVKRCQLVWLCVQNLGQISNRIPQLVDMRLEKIGYHGRRLNREIEFWWLAQADIAAAELLP